MLEVGLKGSFQVKVTDENTARTMKSGDLDVFATPALVAALEAASVDAVSKELEEGCTTVGIKICVDHTAPSVLGMTVTATAELIEVSGRQLTFRVSAYDEKGVIGEGEHKRCIINSERFMTKANGRNQDAH